MSMTATRMCCLQSAAEWQEQGKLLDFEIMEHLCFVIRPQILDEAAAAAVCLGVSAGIVVQLNEAIL